MSNEIAKKLLEKYNAGNCTDEEKAIVESWFLALKDEGSIPGQQKIQQISDEVWVSLPVHQTKVKPLWPRIAAAASILLFLSVGAYFFIHKQPRQQTAQNQTHDVAPGKNQATLTLAGGQNIILKPSLRGQIAQQGNVLIQAGSGNAITYTGTNLPNAKVEYNTLSTARGEMSPYPLILADGTKVWLNAASSITYPTAFAGNFREVRITGEALFEVAHNAAKPFKVLVKGQTIEDIGTEFNVNAYDDEPAMKTTLVRGSIRMGDIILTPGEQAISAGGSKQPRVIDGVNTSIITAWRDGYFRFDEEQLPVILREISRWYNVDVVYRGTIDTHHFKMKVNRNSTLTRALHILSTGGIHYHLEDKKLIIE